MRADGFGHRGLSRKNNGIQLAAVSFRLSAEVTRRFKLLADS
jgi:hypothetical protein